MKEKEFEKISRELHTLKGVYERQIKEIDMEDNIDLKFFYMGCLFALESLHNAWVNTVEWED